MMSSILDEIKEMLGAGIASNVFDTELIIFINSYLSVLTQLGVGPFDGFKISGSDETWSDFLGDDELTYEMAKTFLYLKCRLVFDPPSTSFVIESINSQLKELEWRLVVTSDRKHKYSADNDGGDEDE